MTVALGFETVVFVGEGQTAPVQPVGHARQPAGQGHRLRGAAARRRLLRGLPHRPGRLPGRPAGGAQDHPRQRPARRSTASCSTRTRSGPARTSTSATPPAGWCGRARSSWLETLLGLPAGLPDHPRLGGRAADACSTGRPTGPRCSRSRASGRPTRSDESQTLFLVDVGLGGTTDPPVTAGYTITWSRAGAWTGMVVKNDPGQPIIWIAFACLISGLVLTFYFPRRRAWARLEEGRLHAGHARRPLRGRAARDEGAARGAGRAAPAAGPELAPNRHLPATGVSPRLGGDPSAMPAAACPADAPPIPRSLR